MINSSRIAIASIRPADSPSLRGVGVAHDEAISLFEINNRLNEIASLLAPLAPRNDDSKPNHASRVEFSIFRHCETFAKQKAKQSLYLESAPPSLRDLDAVKVVAIHL